MNLKYVLTNVCDYSCDSCVDCSQKISNSPNGSRICLSNNIYTNFTCIQMIVYHKIIDCNNYIINYNGSENIDGIKINTGSENVTLENCIFQNWTKHSIFVLGENMMIRNNTIDGLDRTNYGMYLTISNSQVLNNVITYTKQSMIFLLTSSSNVLFDGNKFYARLGYDADAIRVYSNTRNCTITNNFFQNVLSVRGNDMVIKDNVFMGENDFNDVSVMYLYNCDNCLVSGNQIYNGYVGIELSSCENVTIQDNTIKYSAQAIFFRNSNPGVIIKDNQMCEIGFDIYNPKPDSILDGNTCMGRSINNNRNYCNFTCPPPEIKECHCTDKTSCGNKLKDANCNTILLDNDFDGQLMINYINGKTFDCQNNKMNSTQNVEGISLSTSSAITIQNCKFIGRYSNAIYATESYFLIFKDSYIQDADLGISLETADFNVIQNVFINKTINYCLSLIESNNIVIKDSVLLGCDDGIYSETINKCTISNNMFIDNANYGIDFEYYCRNNLIDYNVFYNIRQSIYYYDTETKMNTVNDNYFRKCSSSHVFIEEDDGNNKFYNNIFEDGTAFTFSSGSMSNEFNTTMMNATNIVGGDFICGNYYDTYNGNDTNLDGIGDTQITFDTNYIDYCPLIKKYSNLEIISPVNLNLEESESGTPFSFQLSTQGGLGYFYSLKDIDANISDSISISDDGLVSGNIVVTQNSTFNIKVEVYDKIHILNGIVNHQVDSSIHLVEKTYSKKIYIKPDIKDPDDKDPDDKDKDEDPEVNPIDTIVIVILSSISVIVLLLIIAAVIGFVVFIILKNKKTVTKDVKTVETSVQETGDKV